MKKWCVISMLCLMTVAVSTAADQKVKMQLTSGKMYAGSLLERSGQNLSFQASGAKTAVLVPVVSIESLEFKFDEAETATLDRLFENGSYGELTVQMKLFFQEYLPYADIPSNLGPKLTQWLAASYWSGEYEQVLTLAALALKSGSPELADRALFYSMLTFLEQDGSARVKPFLNTAKGRDIFPENSAARLYIEARLLQLDNQYIPAIRAAADLVAAHGRDADWAPQAELLCAELYFQTGRPESAKAVLDSIKESYTNPLITKKAAAIAAQN